MFARPDRSRSETFKKQDVMQWLIWLAHRMIDQNQVPFLIERIQPSWLDRRDQLLRYRQLGGQLGGLFGGLLGGLAFGLLGWLLGGLAFGPLGGLRFGLFVGLLGGLAFGLLGWLFFGLDFGRSDEIDTVDILTWNSKEAIGGLRVGLLVALLFGLPAGLFVGLWGGLRSGLLVGLYVGLLFGLPFGLIGGLGRKQVELITHPGERLFLSAKNFLFVLLSFGLFGGLLFGLLVGLYFGPYFGLFVGLLFGLLGGLLFGGSSIIRHYALRFLISKNDLLPRELIPFLDYCVDLIFLRHVGGGYIFVHRLLMEHFAAMYPADEK